ncbi:hypothetical protein HS088_TW08G00373 [Tripterygium wilfordii]|uniref:Cytochrome b561 domain-containing protein n=1 Tax=Tripterygium wilfordii TaxID=458696 RepID=A0A7J7DBM4_TRIWF|nr:hypothetical protein HS088_TW08G00373 [Tripterygium wilfordii]
MAVLVMILCVFLVTHLSVVAGDDAGDNNAAARGGYHQETTELCSIDLGTILPPPYNNISHLGVKQSQVIPDAGELPLTKVPPTVVVQGAMIYLAFQAKFQNKLGEQPILLAFSSKFPNHHHSHLFEHDDKTSIMFDFSGGSASALTGRFVEMKTRHGVMGILGWGLILPVGAIVPRYLKHKDPLWFYLHTVIQFIGFIFGLTTVVLGGQLYKETHANVPAHRGIGIFVLFLSILQILAFFLRPNKDAKVRKYWNWYHHWFGRIALFFGSLNIVLGMRLAYAGPAWKIGYGFVLGVILLTVIVLEILSRMSRSEKIDRTPAFQMNPVP